MPMITDTSPVAFADSLPEAVDAVVIGAGIAGTACAYFLARAGVGVLLCEKGRVAGEQSSRNWGWVRQQGRDEAELPVMMESNRIWNRFAEETGEADLSFTPSGCLYVSDSEAGLAKSESWYRTALRHQLDTRMLNRGELADLLPGVSGTWAGGLLTPSDGCAEPFVAVPALARAARRAGALIVEGCAVRTLDVAAGRVVGAVTERGRVRCERAVLAAGAWSNLFASNAGIELAQLSVRSTAARTAPVDETVSHNTSLPGLSLRRRDDGGYTVASGDLAEHYLGPASIRHVWKYRKLLKLSAKDVRLKPKAPRFYPGAWTTPRRWSGDEPSPFERARVLDPPASPLAVRRIGERLPRLIPAFRGRGIVEAWAGMIDVTPDAVPLLGETEALPGLVVATGLSGHGFGVGPAVGRIAADLTRGRHPGHDLARFRLGRFRDGSAIVPGPY